MRQHAMHAERDIILAIPSACLSVRPMPVLSLNNGRTDRQTTGHLPYRPLADGLVGVSF